MEARDSTTEEALEMTRLKSGSLGEAAAAFGATHVRSIIGKLGAQSRTEAVRIAVEMNLIQ